MYLFLTEGFDFELRGLTVDDNKWFVPALLLNLWLKGVLPSTVVIQLIFLFVLMTCAGLI